MVRTADMYETSRTPVNFRTQLYRGLCLFPGLCRRQCSICLDISKHFSDEPLDKAVLSQLQITAQGEKVLLRMESEVKEGRLNVF